MAQEKAGQQGIFNGRMMETTAAILLRKTKLSETSLIVTWFTEAHGKIKTVAKGARQPKSRFAGVLDLFFDCEIQFARSRKSDLHQLREVLLRNPHEGMRLDYGRVALAAYFVELIELVTEPDHPAPELHELLHRAFGHLNAQPASLRALMHFESELTRLLGIQGQKNVTPAVAIGRVYHRLPGARPALLKTLKPLIRLPRSEA
jgi:DNA repair protein RecO (recombination protein O)